LRASVSDAATAVDTLCDTNLDRRTTASGKVDRGEALGMATGAATAGTAPIDSTGRLGDGFANAKASRALPDGAWSASAIAANHRIPLG